MPQSSELARALVAYDREAATVVLGALEAEVGRPPDAEVGDPATTTREWKTQFAHHERMRALADELSRLLR